jgi:LemA protein
MLAAIPTFPIGIGALVLGPLLSWLYAWGLRKQDLKTFLFARAPLLPVRTLSAHDDAWLRGEVRCDAPLRCPWFDVPCVAFGYSIEEEQTEYYTDSEGNRQSRTTWSTVHRDNGVRAFELDDGDRIEIALPEGEIEAQRRLRTDYEHSDRRHSAWIVPLDTPVSAFGVKRDDGSFGPLRNVPLLVTFETRNQAVRRSASAEGWKFFFALFWMFAGGFGGTALLLEARPWHEWLVAVGVGLAAMVPVWALLTYNRLVRLRQQVHVAERQISIELAQRTDLVPNLVAVVKAASQHEQDLLQHLAALRGGGSLDQQVRDEEHARTTANAVLVLHEQYPELKSDAMYRDLHDRLWTIEEKVAHARGFYNDTVTEWNDRVQQVPSNLVALLAKMAPKPLFAAGEEAERPPRLALGDA